MLISHPHARKLNMTKIKIGSQEAGSRLDRILRKRLSLMKLSDIYALFRKGGVRVGGRKVKQDYRVAEGDEIDVNVDSSEIIAPKGPDGSLKKIVGTDYFKRNFKIIFEDTDLLACDKPSGLVVHPGTGHLHHDTLIELATGYLLSEGLLKEGEEPALVHRLDRDTSGVILIAKSKRVVRLINELFRNRTDVEKQYVAVCHNRPPEFEGEIVVGLTRTHEQSSGMKMAVSDEGTITRTRYKILEYANDLSRLELYLDTGKTHQIRVHLNHLGCPIVGDSRYGNPELDNKVLLKNPRRLYLHARRLSFIHPFTHKRLNITAPEPKEFREIIERQGGK